MPLSNPDRFSVWAEFMQRLSAERAPIGNLTKTQLRQAIDAVDDWLDANAVEFNQALPAAARTALTAQQKALLLAFVTLKRFG